MGCKQQDEAGGSGLAFLVHHPAGAGADPPAQLGALLDYVFQLPAAPASGELVSASGDINYAALDARLRAHVADLRQQAVSRGEEATPATGTPAAGADASSSSSAAAAAMADAADAAASPSGLQPSAGGSDGSASSGGGSGGSSEGPSSTLQQQQRQRGGGDERFVPPPGRVGPRDVAIDRASVCGAFAHSSDGLSLEALGNFSSCRGNVAVYAGRWFYEATVLTSGIQQIGWATIHCPFTAEEGVGDAPDSYAIDGKRLRKWNVKPQPYGEAWVQGDVIGCGIDLDARTITWWRNGQCLGVAYDHLRVMQPSLAYFPAVSLSHTERCALNFGAKPFAHPVAGYVPLQAPPPPGVRAAADFYCGCLARLALAAVQRPDEASQQRGDAAAVPAGSGGTSTVPAAISSTGKDFNLADHLESSTAAAATATAAAAAAAAASTAAAAAVAAAAAAAGGSGAAAAPTVPGWALVPPFTGPPVAVSSCDMLLLSAIVLEPLQELLASRPYLITSCLLPLLVDLQRLAGEGGPAGQLLAQLQMMHVVWGPAAFRDILFAALEELAFRCQVSPLLVQQYPYTAAYPHLVLAVALLQHRPLRRAFVGHPDFHTVLEGLLSRKAPSPRDLQALLPHVWWPRCKDETASQERLRASVSIITTTLSKVEQRQFELLELLLATPWAAEDDSSSSSGASSSSSNASSSSGDCALLVFVRFLLSKNMYALRDVPPPGLSEPTVLMSTFFGLLRLLQPALTAAAEAGTGPLAAFPVAAMFAAVGPAAEAEAVHGMPRLGGIVSHLAREHPISDAERAPVHVLAAQPGQEQQGGGSGGGSNSGGQQLLHDSWVPELLNSCLLLYAWRVGFNYKMIHSLSSSVAASSAALEELDRMLSSSGGGDGQPAANWLAGTRKVYHEELTRDVRLLTLLSVAFFSPGKQAALCALSRYLALLVTATSDLQPSAPPAAVDGAQQQQQQAADQPQTAPASSAQQQQQPPRTPTATAAAGDDDGDGGLSNLLRFVPLVYVEVVVDFLTALRKAADSAGVAAAPRELAPATASTFIDLAVAGLNNRRIANPDTQEGLLSVVGLLLDVPAWRALLEAPAAPDRAQRLMESLLTVFDSRLWHPATSVLLKVVRDSGFGHAPSTPHPPHSLRAVLLSLLQDGSSPLAALPAATASAAATPASSPARPLAAAAASSPGSAVQQPAAPAAAAVARGFVNRLFSTLNWTLTEFTVAVGELHTLRGRRSILEVQNQYRRTGLMFELSVNFLRLLEFVVPTPAFLGHSVNRTRLRELLQFLLSHFTNGPDARRLNELLQTNPAGLGAASSSGGGAGSSSGGAPPAAAPPGGAAARMAPSSGGGAAVAALPGLGPGQLQAAAAAAAAAAGQPGGGPPVPAYALSAVRYESSSLSERVQKTALLAPLVGIFLALWDCYLSAAAAAAEEAEAEAGAAAPGGGSGCVQLLPELAEMADERFTASLRFLADVDWSAAFPAQPLSVPLRAFGQLLDALAAARAEHDAAVAARCLPEDVPDDFLDPITMELMADPVVLPDSQVVVDRSTIERHLLSSATDPFSRAPLSMEQLQPADELLARIQAWLAEQAAGGGSKKAAATAGEA